MRTIWKRLIVVKTSAQMTGGHSVVGCRRKYGMFVRAAVTANQRNQRMSVVAPSGARASAEADRELVVARAETLAYRRHLHRDAARAVRVGLALEGQVGAVQGHRHGPASHRVDPIDDTHRRTIE